MSGANHKHRRLCACTVVSRGNSILLQYKVASKQWELPGGKMEGRETAGECAARELLEETDLVWVDGFRIGYMDLSDGYSVVVFHCTHFDGIPAVCEPRKQSAIGWFNLDNLPSDMRRCSKKAIKCYRKSIHAN